MKNRHRLFVYYNKCRCRNDQMFLNPHSFSYGNYFIQITLYIVKKNKRLSATFHNQTFEIYFSQLSSLKHPDSSYNREIDHDRRRSWQTKHAARVPPICFKT